VKIISARRWPGGLPKWTIVMRYALPNALIPSVTVLGLALGDLLYGAVLTETVFAWPGMGAYVVSLFRRSISRR
jgi:peptide/nickel transport system permease protein